MKRIIIIIFTALLSAVLFGCSSGQDAGTADPGTGVPEGGKDGDGGSEQGQQPITFSGYGYSAGVSSTRAIGNFPNNGRIGIVAAYAEGASTDWRSYADIQDAGATAEVQADGSFNFTWDAVKYWPFDNSQLVFLAYSPTASEGGTALRQLYDLRYLELNLEQDMPDVLYASENESLAAYSKDPLRTVDLGEFRHALSQLTVKVVADGDIDPNLVVSSVAVSTTRRTAYLDLTAGEDGLSLGVENDFTYPLASNRKVSSASPYTSNAVLVYPGAEDVTSVDITLTDGIVTVTRNYPVSVFENEDEPGQGLTLERAKNTTVTVTVKSASVQDPDQSLTLKGALTEWKPQGSYGVTIY